MEVRTISDLEKYCLMCCCHQSCRLLNDDKRKIETCLIRSGIEIGYQKATGDTNTSKYLEGFKDGRNEIFRLLPKWKKSKPEPGRKYVIKFVDGGVVETTDWREYKNSFFYEDGECYHSVSLDDIGLHGWMYSDELENLPKDE